MSLAAINEQLLRAIGVGVALADPEDLTLLFMNGTFSSWFPIAAEGTRLAELLPEIDLGAVRDAIAGAGRLSLEATIRPKRRPLAIAIGFTRAEVDGRPLAVIECQNISRIRELEAMIDSYSKMVEKHTRDLKREKERSEKLLLNIMPRSVYEEFKAFGVTTPQRFDEASILLLDFVSFTEKTERMDPSTLISELNDIYSAFDRIAEQFGAERIKTIGDAYMAVAGIPEPSADHATAIAKVAVLLLRYLERRNRTHAEQWIGRVGIASGTVVGSVVGIQKYVYDIFGSAVNMASRMENEAGPMQVVATAAMADALRNEFELADLGVRDIKGIGEMRVYEVVRELAGR